MSKQPTRRKQLKLQQKSRDRKAKRIAELRDRVPNRIIDGVFEAMEWMTDGDLDQAQLVLADLGGVKSSRPEVVQLVAEIYLRQHEFENYHAALDRLCVLLPNDPNAHLKRAFSKLYAQRVAGASQDLRAVVDRWPNHSVSTEAMSMLHEMQADLHRLFEELGLDPLNDEHVRLLVLFEEGRDFLRRADFDQCIKKCLDTLSIKSTFSPCRNNLAIAYFHSGEEQRAIDTLVGTLDIEPTNSFARTQLASYYFLTGDQESANQCADHFLSSGVDDNYDAVCMGLEALALMGRDDDILKLASCLNESELNPQQSMIVNHFKAYVHCRKGDTRTSETLWTKARGLPEAEGNLADLQNKNEEGPWVIPLTKWVPRRTLSRMIEVNGQDPSLMLKQFGHLSTLVPALLDRGDAEGRKFAFYFAKSTCTPEMLNALKDFAFGERGPTSMRLDALGFLKEKQAIPEGPHMVYVNGKRTEIATLSFEIYDEPKELCNSQKEQELYDLAVNAMYEQNYALAESLFQKILAENPNNFSAKYNLAIAWLRLSPNNKKKATAAIYEMHREYPDYVHAKISVAQFYILDRKLEMALELLTPIWTLPRLHRSEARALLIVQCEYHIANNQSAQAEAMIEMIERLFDDVDVIAMLRDKLEFKWRSPLSRLSRW